jgi:hypothetical protein
MSFSNWSNDSQAHTQLCILESQLEVKGSKVFALEAENLLLKQEVERLQNLIKSISKSDISINEDVLNRFK